MYGVLSAGNIRLRVVILAISTNTVFLHEVMGGFRRVGVVMRNEVFGGAAARNLAKASAAATNPSAAMPRRTRHEAPKCFIDSSWLWLHAEGSAWKLQAMDRAMAGRMWRRVPTSGGSAIDHLCIVRSVYDAKLETLYRYPSALSRIESSTLGI